MKKGFTLVELSIVLVIVGLLIGGLLVGQSLIDSAKVTKVISQAKQIRIMMQLFTQKYKCVAGDCQRGYIPTNMRGNADNIITYTNEGNQVFAVLKLFEFYKSPDDLTTCGDLTWSTAPKNCFMKGALDTTIFFPRAIGTCGATNCDLGYGPNISFVGGSTAIGQNWLIYGGDLMMADNANTTKPGPSIPSSTAYAIDNKMDDGMPNTGKVMGMRGNATDGYPDASCMSDANAATKYDTTTSDAACILGFYLGIGLQTYVD